MDQSLETPNADPGTESVLPNTGAFVDACLKHVAGLVDRLGWQLGQSLLTRSDQWGLVWRVDFTTVNSIAASKSVRRYVCWGTPDGEILGTKLDSSGWPRLNTRDAE